MASVPLHYIDLRTFKYATEDEARVEAALRRFLPEEFPVERTENEGYHGDLIIVLSTRVENADDMRYVLAQLRECEEIDRITDELDERVDENCSLFLQLDKQAAYQSRVELGQGVMLRAKVEAYPAKKSTAIENARELLTAS